MNENEIRERARRLHALPPDGLRRRIAVLLETHPGLTGFGLLEDQNQYEPDQLAYQRGYLLTEDGIRQVKSGLGYIAWTGATVRPNRRISSYGLKHQVESLIGRYISNGALITAVLLIGRDVARIRQGPNCYLPLPQCGWAFAFDRCADQELVAADRAILSEITLQQVPRVWINRLGYGRDRTPLSAYIKDHGRIAA